MNILQKINCNISYFGYLLISIAINGFFSIYLPDDSPGTPRWAWYFLAIIGASIVGLKTLRFPQAKRCKIIASDILFISILLFFSILQLPYGINFIIGIIFSTFFLRYYIHRKFLIKLA